MSALRLSSIRPISRIGSARSYVQRPTPKPPATKPTQEPPTHNVPHVRHEVHEKTAAINIPFNPPGGGGGGPNPGGIGGSFDSTRSPLADAALTTIVGLGMGNQISPVLFLFKALTWIKCSLEESRTSSGTRREY
jgi:hypothetical protein